MSGPDLKTPKIGKGKAGPGRPKGLTNKVTKAVKDMILGALDDAGGQKYLAEQAEKNPAAFMTLVGKVLPLQIAGSLDVNVLTKEQRDAMAARARK